MLNCRNVLHRAIIKSRFKKMRRNGARAFFYHPFRVLAGRNVVEAASRFGNLMITLGLRSVGILTEAFRPPPCPTTAITK